MARSSRHKSHRSHKHRDRSDSEEDSNSREKKPKMEEEEESAADGSGTRVSRVSDSDKRKSSSKDLIGTSNGDFSGEHVKKRKGRGEDSAVGDRWNGGGDDDVKVDKESKKEGFDTVDLEKNSKSKVCAVELKGKSSCRRREGSSERNEEKRRSEKELGRRESSSSSQYKDGKERERERGSEKDKKVQVSMHERSDDGGSRKEERMAKKDMEISEWPLQDEMRNPELEKELEKRIKRRRDGSGENDKCLGDGRDSDDRRISSRDDHSKDGNYKDERHKDARYREKYKADLERDQRHRDDKHRDEHSARAYTSDRSDNKHFRDESRPSESRYKKTKLQDSDHDDSPCVDDHDTKHKDYRGRKRTSDEIEDHSDVKPRSAKEPREDIEKNGSSSSKFDSRTDRARLEHPCPDKVDSSLSKSRPKSSPSSKAYAVKDQSRYSSRQAESTRRESLSEETRRPSTASRGDHATASGSRERVSESRLLEKIKPKDGIRSDVLLAEVAAASHYDRTPRSDARTSPSQFIEKSPSTSDRLSEKSGARRIIDMEEVGQRSSTSKDGRDSSSKKDNGRERELPVERANVDDSSQVELLNSEAVSVGPSFNRTGPSLGSSPGHLPPPPPVRLGVDSPSVLGLYEDESRIQNGDRKISSRYKRSGDLSMGRGQGTPWKSAPTWSSPVANGFIPLQHGPPAGFHPAVQQFPAPPLFGVRPSMDLNHTGVSYHLHEAANRFSGHAHLYGWHNPVDDCPPHLQVWDGSNNAFGEESHIYGRPEWDQNRHLMGSRGWEMSADMWKGQNGNTNMEFPVPQEQEYSVQALADEAWVGQIGRHSRDERARSERPTADVSGIKRPNDTFPAKNAVGTPSKSLREKTLEPSKMPSEHGTSERPDNNNVRFCCNYLSKLDISLELVQPELYKQCMSLTGTRDGIVAGNVSLQEQPKNYKVAAKSKQYDLNSLFPTATGSIFQRAMSLYKKQNEGMKKLMRPLVCSEGEKGLPEASNAEKVNVDSVNNMEEDPLRNVSSAINREEDPSLANAITADYVEEEKNTTTNAEGNFPGDIEKQQCDNISDAVVLVEGSEECEAIMPECRVNLSRIHLSPENTH